MKRLIVVSLFVIVFCTSWIGVCSAGAPDIKWPDPLQLPAGSKALCTSELDCLQKINTYTGYNYSQIQSWYLVYLEQLESTISTQQIINVILQISDILLIGLSFILFFVVLNLFKGKKF